MRIIALIGLIVGMLLIGHACHHAVCHRRPVRIYSI